MLALMTPEVYCWRYAVGCLDQKLVEHKISKKDYDFALQCIDTGEVPSVEFIQRVFPRPFESLGKECILEAMRKYWRIDHQDPSESSPVHQAILVPYNKQLYPEVDRGMWWYARYYDPAIEDVGRVLVKNNMKYNLKPGMAVYIHGHTIAELGCDTRL